MLMSHMPADPLPPLELKRVDGTKLFLSGFVQVFKIEGRPDGGSYVHYTLTGQDARYDSVEHTPDEVNKLLLDRARAAQEAAQAQLQERLDRMRARKHYALRGGAAMFTESSEDTPFDGPIYW